MIMKENLGTEGDITTVIVVLQKSLIDQGRVGTSDFGVQRLD
jgi:hypothetical protein